jgi:NAD(P)-dependent dehydrogenase (short-subunit alcohol dehydrogenase family)
MAHVVITGSSRGIGFALAEAFLALGARVTVSGRTQASTRAALERLRATNPAFEERLDGIACDVTRTDDIEALWQRARSHGPVDVWINNAGVGAPLAPLWDVGVRVLENVLDVNVRGVLLGSSIAIRGMREQGHGAIYNMEGFGSDGSAVRGALAYGASKCTVGYISRQLAREARGGPVSICTIEPGAVRTELTQTTWYGPGVSPRLLVAIESLALGPGEVARLLAPRLLDNRQSGVRIRPWNAFIAWTRILVLPMLAMLRPARMRAENRLPG